MYYEEKLVNGRLMCRTDPQGQWTTVSQERVASLYVELQTLRKEQAKQTYAAD